MRRYAKNMVEAKRIAKNLGKKYKNVTIEPQGYPAMRPYLVEATEKRRKKKLKTSRDYDYYGDINVSEDGEV